MYVARRCRSLERSADDGRVGVAGTGREDGGVRARRRGGKEPDELFHRHLLGVHTRQNRHDVAGGRSRHGGPDRWIRVLSRPDRRRRIGDIRRRADEQVLCQRGHRDDELNARRGRRHVPGDVANRIRPVLSSVTSYRLFVSVPWLEKVISPARPAGPRVQQRELDRVGIDRDRHVVGCAQNSVRPGADQLDRRRREMGLSMFSLVIVKLIGRSACGDDLVRVGEVKLSFGGVVSTTNGNWALGSAGLDWLPLWSMIRPRAT